MSDELKNRSGNTCELCGSTDSLSAYTVPPKSGASVDDLVMTCGICSEQLNNEDKIDSNHWRCLNDSMWSEVPAVKVVAWRMLNKLKGEGWPADLLDMMYMEDDTLEWAKEGIADDDGANKEVHRDSNGVELTAGDTVTIIKDLNVKGSSLVAKRGTAVRNISLVHDHPDQIEGKVEGQKIVILTQFVKK